jgi:hypothetical protein
VCAAVGCLFLLTSFSVDAGAARKRKKPVRVVVTNKDTSPVPVKVQDVRVDVPVQAKALLVLLAGVSSASAELFVPPPGKLLVVEYLTITVDSRNEEQAYPVLRTGLDGEEVSHNLGPLPARVQTGLGSGWTIMLQRNLVAYSDEAAVFSYTRGTGFLGERAIVQVSMSGRLLDGP